MNLFEVLTLYHVKLRVDCSKCTGKIFSFQILSARRRLNL